MIHFDSEVYVDNLYGTTIPQFDYRNAMRSGDFVTWQKMFRERLREISGLNLIGAATRGLPLSPRVISKAEFDSYILEKIYITTEPGIEIPFYLLLPKRGTGPFPLVLTPHGHGRRGKEVYVGNFAEAEEQTSSLAGDRDIALQAVSAGYAVIAPDVRGFWEMSRSEEFVNKENDSCAELQRRSLMFGRSLIGERVHDMGRLIDYAMTRSEIDSSKIVITGNSGGGTVSLFAAACDERISIAIPGSYFCTFRDSIMAMYHCPCNIVPGILQYGEMYDVAGLIAPRPILVVHGVDDSIYPIRGTREAFAHLEKIYNAMGAQENCELYVGSGGHRYYKERVWNFVQEKFDR